MNYYITDMRYLPFAIHHQAWPLRLLVLAMLLVLLPTAGFAQSRGGGKQALLIGISSNAAGLAKDSLHTRRDIEAVSVALQRQGFNDVRILQDEDATKKGVLDAIAQLNPQLGTSLVLFFSMHGQQLPDDADLDYEPDGKDEALVLYGAPTEFPTTYKGEKHLRDDELRSLLDALRAKVGPKGEVLLLVDACYSGTIDRGPTEYWAPIRSTGAVTKNEKTRLEGTGLADVEGAKSEFPDIAGAVATRGIEPKWGALTVITAARADQETREIINDQQSFMGALSFSFCKALETADRSTTYSGLFQDIQHAMISKQSNSQPQLHGDPDRLLFQGKAVERMRHISVLSQQGPDTVLLDMGTLGGLSVGSKVGLFPAETRSPSMAREIASGTIIEASDFRARAVWNRSIAPDTLSKSWILVTQHCYGNLCPRLKLDCGSEGLCKMAAIQLKESGIVQLVDDHPELVIAGNGGRLVLRSELGDTLYDSLTERGDSARLVRMLEKRLSKCMAAKCIRATTFSDSRYKIAPYIVLEADSLKLTPRSEFQMGDKFIVAGRHLGDRPAYYNIVYLEGWEASLLAPWDGGDLDQLLVQPGETFQVAIPFEFTKERGPYQGVFKIIATETKLDLRGIVDMAGDVRGNDPKQYSPIEWMIRNTLKDRVRRSQGMEVDVDLTHAWTGEVGVGVR